VGGRQVLLVRRHATGGLNLLRHQPLRTNGRDLVMQVVMGEISDPVGHGNAYRIGHDGVPRILLGPGGIVIGRRIGDPCVGFAEDHVEPGWRCVTQGAARAAPANQTWR